MRDLALFAVLAAGLPAALFRPWIGLLLWSWIGYMNPHRLTWGAAYSMPLAKVAALATLAGLVVAVARGRLSLPRAPEVVLLALLWAWMTVTTFFAYYPDVAWDKWLEMSKTLLLATVTLLLFQDVARLRWLVWVIVASIGFFGVKSGIGALVTGFQGGYSYPPASMIGDNNNLALAFDMALPLIWFLAQTAAQPWVRRGMRAVFVLTICGVLTTHSRGGFLGLCAVLTVIALRTGRKRLAVLALGVAALTAAALLPGNLVGRLESIGDYQSDLSAQSRLRAWAVAIGIALDSPIVGGGFRAFGEEVWERYAPDVAVDPPLVAHSIYFQTLGEHGFVGLALFVALLVAHYRGLGRARRWALARSPDHWGARLASMLEASLASYMVAGSFSSRSDFDLFYHLVAVGVLVQGLVAPTAAPAAPALPAAGRPRVGVPAIEGSPARCVGSPGS